MSLVAENFEDEKCRIESGIFYSTDIAQRIYYDASKGYFCGGKEPLSSLIEENGNDWWGEFAPLVEFKEKDHLVLAGGGAYEGEGFVAFICSGKLQWILHMEASEAFSTIEFINRKIIATAKNYPHDNRIEIPINSPGEFVFEESTSL